MEQTTLYRLIDEQIDSNYEKSLFYTNQPILTTSVEFRSFLITHFKAFKRLYPLLKGQKPDTDLISHITQKMLRNFTDGNQFLYFTEEHQEQLRSLYRALIDDLFKLSQLTEENFEILLNAHYEALKHYLLDTNQKEIFKLYYENPTIPKVECSLYSVPLQLKLLNLTTHLKEPILDIGCGNEGNLVHYLNTLGLKVMGIDRDVEVETEVLKQIDWFRMEFKEKSYGTIISHMAFSNHFMHHHLKADGDYLNYAILYKTLLNALKINGSFIYTPGLPFMEEILRTNKNFKVLIKKITNEFYMTKITRIQ